jgi:hypothetical protein
MQARGGRNPAYASPKCRPSKSGGIVSRPTLSFEPTFEQELLWIRHACPRAEPLDSCRLRRKGVQIYIKDGRKGRRPKPPDRNGDATRPGDHGQAPAQGLRSEFGTPEFPCFVEDACGPRDGRRPTRKTGASDAARSVQSHGSSSSRRQLPTQRSATPFCQGLSNEVHTAFIFRNRMAAGTRTSHPGHRSEISEPRQKEMPPATAG